MNREMVIERVSEGMSEFVRSAIAMAIANAKDPLAPTKVEICDAMRGLTEILVEDVQNGGMDELLGWVYKYLKEKVGE